jgi:hypothetical protein
MIRRHAPIMILSFVSFFASQVIGRDHTIEIDSAILKLVDNIGKMDIGQMMLAVSKLKHIQNGDKSQNGLITFKDKKFTLKQFVTIEQVALDGCSTGADRKAEEKKLKDSLDDAITQVKEASRVWKGWADLVKEHKSKMVAVIQQWANQRKRSSTLLLKWGDMEEDRFITRYMTSFKILSTFVDDLVQFLLDVKHSCPKCKKIFEEKYKKLKESHV